MNRRNFLKGIALTAATASAVGGSAALLLGAKDKAPPVITALETPPPLPAVAAAETAATASGEAAELLSKLAAAQADNLRLRAELDAALRRLNALQSANGDAGKLNDSLQTELATANHRVSLLAGLVALYEQLDGIELAETVDEKLETFGMTIYDLVDGLPDVEEGLASGQRALEAFEAHIPQLQSGRDWLESQLGRLNTFYAAAEKVLAAAVETAGDFLQKLDEWFEDVLKWLPFGVGSTAAEIMATLSDLLNETPQTIQGLRRNVADPLDVWLADKGDGVPLRGHLIKPIKEEALEPATRVVDQVRETRTAYEKELVEPIQVAVKSRRLVREQIDAYRKKYEL